MSHNKKYRILPIGFIFFVIGIIIAIISVSLLLRTISPSSKLLYLISKTLDTEQHEFSSTVKISTSGDTVKSSTKDLILKSNISINKKENYFKSTNNLSIDGNAIPGFNVLLADDSLFFKPTESDVWSNLGFEDFHLLFNGDPNFDMEFEKFINIMDLDDPKLKSIFSSNLISFKTHFRDCITYKNSNKNEIIISFTLNHFFDKINFVVDDLLRHKYFEDSIMSRVPKLYSIYGDNSVIEYLNLDSTIMFSNLVKWNNNFEAAIYKRLSEYEQRIYNTFKQNSEVRITFTYDDSEIISSDINLLLYHKSRDATENINIIFEKVKVSDIDTPNIEDCLKFSEGHTFYNYWLEITK